MRRPDHFPFSSATTRLARAVVMWLVALAMPFDGAAIGAQAARGSLHVHVAATAQPMRLVDFRRDGTPPTTAAHRHTTAQRHRHAFADASVVAVDDGSSDGDGLLAASALSSALGGLPTAVADWSAAPGVGDAPSAASWTPSFGCNQRLERPPRALRT